VNKDDIFNLFEDNPEEKKIQTVTIEEFLENSQVEVGVFQIGMFTKLISNHHIFHAKLKKFFEAEEVKYDFVQAKNASNFAVYHRAWFYINQIEVDNPGHVKAIKEFESTVLSKSLDSAIFYYEEREEYEKCAHLLKIKKLMKKS